MAHSTYALSGKTVVPISPMGLADDVTVKVIGDSTVYLGDLPLTPLTGYRLDPGSSVVWQATRPLHLYSETATSVFISDNAGNLFDADAVGSSLIRQGLAGEIGKAIALGGAPSTRLATEIVRQLDVPVTSNTALSYDLDTYTLSVPGHVAEFGGVVDWSRYTGIVLEVTRNPQNPSNNAWYIGKTTLTRFTVRDDETVIIEDLAAFSAPDWGTLRLTIPVTWGSKADIDSESPIAIFDAAQWNALLGLSGGAPKYWPLVQLEVDMCLSPTLTVRSGGYLPTVRLWAVTGNVQYGMEYDPGTGEYNGRQTWITAAESSLADKRISLTLAANGTGTFRNATVPIPTNGKPIRIAARQNVSGSTTITPGYGNNSAGGGLPVTCASTDNWKMWTIDVPAFDAPNLTFSQGAGAGAVNINLFYQ